MSNSFQAIKNKIITNHEQDSLVVSTSDIIDTDSAISLSDAMNKQINPVASLTSDKSNTQYEARKQPINNPSKPLSTLTMVEEKKYKQPCSYVSKNLNVQSSCCKQDNQILREIDFHKISEFRTTKNTVKFEDNLSRIQTKDMSITDSMCTSKSIPYNIHFHGSIQNGLDKSAVHSFPFVNPFFSPTFNKEENTNLSSVPTVKLLPRENEYNNFLCESLYTDSFFGNDFKKGKDKNIVLKQKSDYLPHLIERSLMQNLINTKTKRISNKLDFIHLNEANNEKSVVGPNITPLKEIKKPIRREGPISKTRINQINTSKVVRIKNKYKKRNVAITLNQVEMFAKSFGNLTYCSNGKIKSNALKKVFKNIKTFNVDSLNFSEILLQKNYTIGECIYQMTNKAFQKKQNISSLQQALLNKLCEINKFISILKSFPNLDEEIISEVNSLRENVSSFPVGNKVSEFELSQTKEKIKEIEPEINILLNQSTATFDSFATLIDELPDELHCQKKYISLYNNSLYCTACEMPITFAILNVMEHIRGKTHLKMINYSVNGSFLSNGKMVIGKKHCLPLNYQGILAIVRDSHLNGMEFNIPVYICRHCDFLCNNKGKAMSHLHDQAHKKKHKSTDNKWHTCDSCCITIYGTDEHFVEHCKTVEHSDVMRIRTEHIPRKSTIEANLSKLEPVIDGEDQLSVCTSKSYLSNNKHRRLHPHEILLSIVKENWNKEFKSTMGLYCQICNEYYFYNSSLTDHYKSEKHKNILFSLKSQDKYKIFSCATCKIDLFGDKSILNEHNSFQIHIELANISEKYNKVFQKSNIKSDADSIGLSNEGGPHFDFMKMVLKKHLTNESKKYFFGFYCSICEVFCSDDQNWKYHINSASHGNRINASDCVGKKMCYDCFQCNIRLICDKHVFSLHKKSLAHEAICRRQVKVNHNNTSGDSSEDDNDSESPENDKLAIDNNENQSNTLSNKSFNNKDINQRRIMKKCIYESGPTAKIKQSRINDYRLHEDIVEVLQSQERLQDFKTSVLGEVDESNQSYKNEFIKKDILAAVPGCKVHFFGSQVTGLASKNSDFDIYIDFNNRSYFKGLHQKEQEEILNHLLSKFALPTSSFQVIERVFDARVPIIRVIHNSTNTLCDISCRSGLSVENSQLVRLFVSSDHRVSWLIVVIKWWMDSSGLLNRNIFTSYATTWLVLFFLMRLKQPVLCSVSHLQIGCPDYTVAHWDCRFTRNINKCFKTVNKQSQFELLAEFFCFYGTLSCMSVVLCPLTATLIPRHHFDVLRIPPAYSSYVKNVKSSPNPERLRTSTSICLQDPFDLSHNITKGVSLKDLKKFKSLCKESAQICKGMILN